MKKIRIIAIMLLVAMLVPVFTSCKKEKKAEKFQVIDVALREVVINGPAEKVVVLSASDCEILYALGAEKTIIGRGTFCEYPEEAKKITEVKTGSELNIEEIIALEPDVVIMGKMSNSAEVAQSIQDISGIAVVITNGETLHDIEKSITLIGKVVGKENEAEVLNKKMEDTFMEIAERVEEPAGKTIYFESSPLEYGLWAAGEKTYMDQMANMLGVTNIFNDIEVWGAVSEEQVISRDPDYIISTTDYGNISNRAQEIMDRPGWQEMKAVKNGNIYAPDSNILTIPGPRLVEAMEYLYSIIYE